MQPLSKKIQGNRVLRKMSLGVLAIFVGIAVCSPAVQAGIYKWVDDQGQVHFGDRPTGVVGISSAEKKNRDAPPVMPRVERTTGLANTPEIPPSAGYNQEFQRIANQPMTDNQRVIPQLKENIQTLPTPYLFELARRLAHENDIDAIKWFWVARIRARYDAARCADKSAAQGASYWPSYAIKAFEMAKRDMQAAGKIGFEAIELEKAFPADSLPEWICRHGMQAMLSAIQKRPMADMYVPRSEWPALHEKVIAGARESFSKMQ
jgi:hypothetical protein